MHPEEVFMLFVEAINRHDVQALTWQTPAAWKAVIRESKMMEWRVFADNKPVYEILAKRN